MRISDWSSDVCSSDLKASADTGPAAVPAWPASGAAARAPSRLRLGAGIVEHAASTVAMRAAANALGRERRLLAGTLRFLAGRWRFARVRKQRGAPRLDAPACGVELIGHTQYSRR